MRYPPDLEKQALLEIQRDPAAHLFVSPGRPEPGVAPYQRADGAVSVHRDGVQEFLHRRLYRLVVDPSIGRHQLSRSCDAWGCVNPHHYEAGVNLSKRSRATCANGHDYTVTELANGHCGACADARREKRRSYSGPDAAEINAAKTHCPAGHEYTVENTYLYLRHGSVHRKCRACNAERAARRRARPALAKAA